MKIARFVFFVLAAATMLLHGGVAGSCNQDSAVD